MELERVVAKRTRWALVDGYDDQRKKRQDDRESFDALAGIVTNDVRDEECIRSREIHDDSGAAVAEHVPAAFAVVHVAPCLRVSD